MSTWAHRPSGPWAHGPICSWANALMAMLPLATNVQPMGQSLAPGVKWDFIEKQIVSIASRTNAAARMGCQVTSATFMEQKSVPAAPKDFTLVKMTDAMSIDASARTGSELSAQPAISMAAKFAFHVRKVFT